MKNLKITLLLATSICSMLRASDNPTMETKPLIITLINPGIIPTEIDPLQGNKVIRTDWINTSIQIKPYGTFSDIAEEYRKTVRIIPDNYEIIIVLEGVGQDPNSKYDYDQLVKHAKIFAKLQERIQHPAETSPSTPPTSAPNTLPIEGKKIFISSMRETEIVPIQPNKAMKTYGDIIAEYKKICGLADDVTVKLTAKGEDLKPEDTYDAEYVDQFPHIYAIIYRDWEIKPRGNLLTANTSFAITLFPDEPNLEKDPKEKSTAQDRTSIKFLKQTIIDEITKLTNEKNYTITITKNGNPLDDTDKILFTEPLALYSVTLSKPSRFQLWANWLQQQKDKVLGFLGIAAAGSLGLYIYSQKNKSLPSSPH